MESKKQKKQEYNNLTEEENSELDEKGLNISESDGFESNEETYKRLTKNAKYTQEWKEYNEAQTKEKLMFYKLLDELLNVIPLRKYTFGRPRKSLRDMIFCCMIKIYNNTSSRRIISDLELAKRAGYIGEVPHFNTVLNYFDDSGMKIILDYLIQVSALPLKQVEEQFAVDSTGFGTQRFDRWVDIKYRLKSPLGKYRKAHVTCGVKTNVITSLQVTDGNVNDSKMFEALITETAENFNMKEVSADKAYSSRANMDLANKLGAMPFIPFKKNVTGKSGGSPTWAKMHKMFAEDYLEFAKHYHKRSNVESCFAMIKRKFGDNCRCKSGRSQNNEIRCKVLAHNLVVLIHEIFELKIEVDFADCAKYLPAQKVV
jgi:transposase